VIEKMVDLVGSIRLSSYEEALWNTVSGPGDRDTICDIVGGIVVMYAGIGNIRTFLRMG
jgi:ADP-ribosylglycohydrolase